MLTESFLRKLKDYVTSHTEKVEVQAFTINYMIRPFVGNVSESMAPQGIEDFVNNHRKPSFNNLLFNLIDKKGVTDSEIYNKAGIDRRHFSKIRSNPDYHPSKNTAIALSMALELNVTETKRLIGAASYTLSHSDKFDLVILYCIMNKKYFLPDVNQALEYFSLKPLSGVIE